MPFKKRGVDSALEQKGFKRIETDHSYFIYFTQTNKKSRVRTKTSHGNGGKDIPDGLLSYMATQCKLNNKQFSDLIKCPLSRNEYESILIEKGFADNG